MSKHWKRFAAVVVSLTMAFQFCVNDFYAYAETNAPEQETVVTNTGQPQTPAEPEASTEPAPEAETDTTDPAQTPAEDTASEQESQDSDPAQGQAPVNEEEQPQEQEEAASTLKLEFKDEAGTALKTVDPIALTGKTVGQPISLAEVGVDTNIEGYTLVDIKDKNDSTKDYNASSVEFTLTKNVTELQLVYRANPKEGETQPAEGNNTNTTEDSQQGEEDSEDDSEEADTKDEDSEEPKEELKKSPLASMFISQKSASLFKVEDGENVYYEINFVDQDGGSIERQFVLAGQTTEAPILDWSSSTLEEGTQFVGWKSSLDDQVYSNAEIAEKTVEQDITYTAVFKKTEKYTVTVNYVYADGTVAAQPYVAEVELGKSFGTTINLPSIDGFSATSGYQGLDFTFDKDRNTASINISDGNKENKVYTVTYEGEECTYTVVHKFETFTDGEYKENPELASRETLTGTIGLETQASPKEISGFTANPIQQVKLTGEDTVIEITYERNSYVLTYDSDGGTYVAPITLKYGQEIPYPTAETMKKVGYDFAGWDLQQSTPTMPAGNLTVKANWNSAKYASYKVVYWLEKVPVNGVSAGYDYITSEDGSGRVGERISYDELSDWQWEQANIKPQGVELNNQLSNEVVTITPDGQAVKNVYYSRTTFTIKFYRHEKIGTGFFGRPIYDWVEDQDIRITAKYGEDVSDKWATACENNQWATSKYLDEWYTLIANMPAQDKTLYADNLATGKTIYYYIQDLNGEWKVYQSFQAGSGVSLSDVDKQPIEGFSFKDWKKDGNPLWLYYERNSYNITFENASGVKDASVKFEASIKSAKPNDSDVEPPAGIDEDYVFGGWYYSPACEDGTEVDWNSDTMPAHNLQVYAKWSAPEYKLTFDTNDADNADDSAFDQQTLTKYDEINVPEVEPTKEGYKFLGWYIDKNCESKFVDGQQITKDTTLYAKWEDENKVFDYTIKYVDENGETIDSVTDSGSEGETINIELKDIVKDDGTTYYPAESSKNFVLNEDEMVVTIQYKKAETWSYVVKYLDSETNQSISSEVNKTTQFGVVLETAKFIEGYTLSDDSSFVQIVTKGQSEVTFYYDKIPTSQYTIEYIAKNEDGTERILEESKEPIPANVGEYVTADDKAFEHYDLLSTSTYSRSIVVKEDADKNVIKVYYAPKKYDYTVKYYYETEVGGGYEEDTDAAETVSVEYNTVIDEYTDKVKDGYVFEKVENLPLTVTDDADQNIIKVYYAIDEDGKEGTPDKYEATVTFKVENGYFNGEEGTDSIGPVEYVLATKDETTNT
ncbi:MAG TPA: InlB B-repeat-containing protein, partial [Candidatus Faecalicoccus intestinipullorum]|nr:InlB B-repeat-containing protein [Candidatus Faecalicoccus intestinipullorum]